MSAKFQDYYATLGVGRDASPDDIKKAFRKLARKYHPDTASDKKAAEEKFKEINEANEVLSDPEKRKKYDTLGANWNDASGFQPPPQWGPGAHDFGGDGAQEFHFGGTGFSDFFEQFFSNGRRQSFPHDGVGTGFGGARTRRGHDIEGDILVTLEEAMHGTVRSISLQTVERQTGQTKTQTIQVRIPVGVTDGQRIRVAGHGEPGVNGGTSGDLFLRVRHSAHPEFTTRGADVHHELELPPWDVVLGAEVTVPTLDGKVTLRVPPGTENGQTLRVRGRGLPRGKTGERGDFFVHISILTPKHPSDTERSLWEQLRSSAHS